MRILLACLALPLAAHAELSPCADLAGVRANTDEGRLLANWREVYAALNEREAMPASDAVAVENLCGGTAWCAAQLPISVITGGMASPIDLVVADAGKLRLFRTSSDTGSPPTVQFTPLGSATWVQVQAESLGREPFCETDEDGNESCTTATMVVGQEAYDFVLEGNRLLWAAACLTEEETPQPSRVKREGSTYTLTTCGKSPQSLVFTLDHLRACAPTEVKDATFMTTGGAAAPAEISRLLTAGRKATQEKRFAEATAAFDALLKIDPQHARARSERGFAYLMNGQLDQAEADFETALTYAAQDTKIQASTHFNLGLIAEKRGNPVAARSHFEAAHKLNPSAATKKKLGLP